MRCCIDLIKFVLFLVNLLCFLGFLLVVSGTLFVLFKGEDTFIGENIQPDLSSSNPTAIYFTLVIIILVLSSFFLLFTCLGCCGAACKSSCMIGSFIVILFVLFGGSVGGLIFLHYQYGLQAISDILTQELEQTIASYRPGNNLIRLFWDWINTEAVCCGTGQIPEVWKSAVLDDAMWKVPKSCCKPDSSCMFEPSQETANLYDCVPRILLYVQVVVYGLPCVMFVSLVFAFVVAASVNHQERRKVEARPYHSHSQYSIGAEEEFQNYSYPSAPEDHPPYNPQYEYNNYRNVMGEYPVGTVPPPSTAPLLHEAPPSYNEVFMRK